MSHQAPAVGGASTSAAASALPPAHSAWNPYSILPPTTRRKIDPRETILSKSYLQELAIPGDVAAERIANKYLQLDPPEGKMSDRRKDELARRAVEKEKKRIKKVRDGECGLVGRRKRLTVSKEAQHRVSYAAVEPVHQLWLGYMAELLQLPIAGPRPSPSPPSQTSTRTVLLPTFPERQGVTNSSPATDLQLNVTAIHSKLVKAEFVGCKLSVKRAKNPSLVGLSGIVLQETQGTFKIVTAKSQVKILPKQGSIFAISLPLESSSTMAANAHRQLSFDVFGDQFAYRSVDRVGRKWKAGSSGGGVELS